MNGRFVKLLAGAALSSVAMFGGVIQVESEGTLPAGTPYEAYLGASTTLSTVVCDDNDDTISTGEIWQANDMSLYSLINASSNAAIDSTRFGQSLSSNVTSYNTTNHTGLQAQTVATDIYEAVGWLVLKLVNAPSNPTATNIQDAIWDLMNDPSNQDIYTLEKASSGGWSTSADGGYVYDALTEYNASVGGLTTTQEQQLDILTPTNWNGSSWTGTPHPQEFWTVVPEPTTYAFFGMGLILLSLGTYRRRSKKRS
jgi:hypothetical protein